MIWSEKSIRNHYSKTKLCILYAFTKSRTKHPMHFRVTVMLVTVKWLQHIVCPQLHSQQVGHDRDRMVHYWNVFTQKLLISMHAGTPLIQFHCIVLWNI